MKKIIACIIVYLLMVVFMFTAIKLNAAEIVEEDTPTIEEQTPTNPPINDEELNIITIYLADIVFDNFQLNDENNTFDFYEIVDNTPTTDDNTQEEVDKVPTIIEDKAKEFTDYIIALVISFLGSSAFYAIVKALTKKGINALTSKVAALDEQNKIAELEKQFNQATDKMDVVLGQITNYLEVDANKQKQMAELLEKLLPPLTIEDPEIKEGE